MAMSVRPRPYAIGAAAIGAIAAATLMAPLSRGHGAELNVGRPATAPPHTLQLTWADEFNGAAGSPPDPGKWGHDIGGGGWGNQELQYYTNSTRNAAHDGQGHLVITARRENSGRVQLLVRHLPVHLRAAEHGRAVHPGLRPVRGAHQAAARSGHLAGVLDARQQHRQRRLARPAARSTSWRTSAASRPPSTAALHGPGYSGGNSLTGAYTLPGGAFADDFHTFTVDWAPNSLTWYVDGQRYQLPHPGRHPRQPLGVRPSVLPDPQRRRRRVLAGQPGRQHPVPAADGRRLRAGLRRQDSGPGPTGPITGYGGQVRGRQRAPTRPTAPPSSSTTATAPPPSSGPSAPTAPSAPSASAWTSSGGGTANGTKVQLWDCNGSGAQQWRISAAHDIVNPQANKCLDATGWSSANGTRLQIWDCTGGANQKWNAPA